MPNDLTIDSKIMLQIVDRMTNIVNGYVIRGDRQNKTNTEVFELTGDYLLSGPNKVNVEVLTSGANVQFTYDEVVLENDFSINPTFTLFDIGFDVSITDLEKLIIGDKFDFRFNNSTVTLIDIRTWLDTSADMIHPFLEVIPVEIKQTNKMTNDRRQKNVQYLLQFEYQFSAINDIDPSILIFEVCGDIQDEIQRNNRFQQTDGSCWVIDSEITNINPYLSKADSDLGGAFLTLDLSYRVDLKDSRVLKP